MGVSILIMNEDRSPTAYEALRHLVRRMCQLLCPGLPTQHLTFSPTPAELVGCVRAGQWQSANPRHLRQQVDLAQTIAAQLATEPGFVVFHYDGDCAWADRETCIHDPHFETNVRQRVRVQLSNRVPASELDVRMSKLIVVKPFYCLEAWTYQNFDRARALCAQLGHPPGSERLDEWEADPGLLDEVLQVPEVFPLAKGYNVELTRTGYPAERVYLLGKSFTASVEAARACGPLDQALSRLATPDLP